MMYKAYIDSGDPSLNLIFGDVLYGIEITVKAINEKDAEYKAIRKFKDIFYTNNDVIVTKITIGDDFNLV